MPDYCHDISDLVISNCYFPTSVETTENELSTIAIYPNPLGDNQQLLIDLSTYQYGTNHHQPKTLQLSIIDTWGRQCWKQSINSIQLNDKQVLSLDLADLPIFTTSNAIYYFTINDGKNLKSYKIIR